MMLALVPLLELAAAVIVGVPAFVSVALKAADAIGQPAAGRQMRLAVGVGAAEIDQAGETGDGVVVGVLSRDGERERTPGHGRGRRPGDREVVERARRDDDVGAGSRGRVESRGNRLVADLRQRRAEAAGAGAQAARGRAIGIWLLVSVLLKLTCPPKPVTVLSYTSWAVTVNENACPALLLAGVPAIAK